VWPGLMVGTPEACRAWGVVEAISRKYTRRVGIRGLRYRERPNLMRIFWICASRLRRRYQVGILGALRMIELSVPEGMMSSIASRTNIWMTMNQAKSSRKTMIAGKLISRVG